MQAIEFESKSCGGIIEIPKIHKGWHDETVKVILLKESKSGTRDNADERSELMHFFDQFNADLTNYRFDRDEANER